VPKNSYSVATVSQTSLIQTVTNRIQAIIEEAESGIQPLELDPHRSSLFELFVMADGAHLLGETVEPNLSSDAIAKTLADRWNLRSAAAASLEMQDNLSSESLSKMRLMWSFLRMWMEWTYAWERWHEFHDNDTPPVS
jgi:hypothetical protein